MPDSSTTSNPVSQSFVVPNSVYTCLTMLELTLIGIKYQGFITNPFQEHSIIILLFLVAIFSHAIALTAKIITWPTTMIIHVSGVFACETLLWILVHEFWRWIVINVILILVAALSFYCKDTCGVLSNGLGKFLLVVKNCKVGQQTSNGDQIADLEAGQGVDAQRTNSEPANTS